MKLIVGLGNPGANYNFTRHNFGFLALDFHAKIAKLNWQPREKFGATWLKSEDTIFIKPQTFYNDTGRAVQSFAHFYKIPLENIFVICDDFNIPFGTTRLRQSGSAGGNKGLQSIIEHLGTDKFARLRLGTGNDAIRQKLGDTDFVLSRFTPEEKAKLPEILQAVSKTHLSN